MKKNLYLCNTYYQVIVAIQLNMTVFKEDTGVIALSDHCVNSEKIFERLSACNAFEEVWYLKNKYICKEHLSFSERIEAIRYGIKGNVYCDMGAKKYDRLLYYNDNPASMAIYAELYKFNKDLECIRFEEGIGSYCRDVYRNRKTRIIEFVRRVAGLKNLYSETKEFYCFQPDLYCSNLTPRSIPLIDKKEDFLKIIKCIFLDSEYDYSINQKYIFFGSTYDFEGNQPIGEAEIVRQLAEVVGKDNIIVKKHPRDKRTVYAEDGIKEFKHSEIPWEALQLVLKLEGKVFLTIVSSSVLSLNLTLEKPVKTYFLYDLSAARENTLANEMINLIENLVNIKNYNLEKKNVLIAKELNDVIN